MTATLVPIFICVVLPVAIVLIVSWTKMSINNSRTQILMKAIEVNKDVDIKGLAESMRQPRRTPKEILNLRLLRGCMFLSIGVVLIITSIILLFSETIFNSDISGMIMVIGAILIAIGASYLIVYRITRSQVKPQDEYSDTDTPKEP